MAPPAGPTTALAAICLGLFGAWGVYDLTSPLSMQPSEASIVTPIDVDLQSARNAAAGLELLTPRSFFAAVLAMPLWPLFAVFDLVLGAIFLRWARRTSQGLSQQSGPEAVLPERCASSISPQCPNSWVVDGDDCVPIAPNPCGQARLATASESLILDRGLDDSIGEQGGLCRRSEPDYLPRAETVLDKPTLDAEHSKGRTPSPQEEAPASEASQHIRELIQIHLPSSGVQDATDTSSKDTLTAQPEILPCGQHAEFCSQTQRQQGPAGRQGSSLESPALDTSTCNSTMQPAESSLPRRYPTFGRTVRERRAEAMAAQSAAAETKVESKKKTMSRLRGAGFAVEQADNKSAEQEPSKSAEQGPSYERSQPKAEEPVVRARPTRGGA